MKPKESIFLITHPSFPLKITQIKIQRKRQRGTQGCTISYFSGTIRSRIAKAGSLENCYCHCRYYYHYTYCRSCVLTERCRPCPWQISASIWRWSTVLYWTKWSCSPFCSTVWSICTILQYDTTHHDDITSPKKTAVVIYVCLHSRAANSTRISTAIFFCEVPPKRPTS